MLSHSRSATLRLLPMLIVSLLFFCAPRCLADEITVLEAGIQDLQSDHVEVRRQAAVRLGRLADRAAAAALVPALHDTDAQVRCEAAKALGFIKSSAAVVPLVAALNDDEPNVRFYAAYALGELKDLRAGEALLQALDDPEWSVRDQAAWALREIRDASVAFPLIAKLSQDKVDVAQMVWILKGLDRASVLGMLSSGLRSPSDRTRRRLVQALGALHDPQAAVPLFIALSDSSPAVRQQAVEHLAESRDARALEPLQKMAVEDKDERVRAAAQQALERFSHDEDLAAYWSFDDTNAGTAADRTGHGNDGRSIGCAKVKGIAGQGLRFGPGCYVEIGKPPDIPIADSPFTVMAWIKTQAPEGVVVARGGAACGFSLYVKDGLPKFGIHRLQGGPGYIAESSVKLNSDWTHLAGVVKEQGIEVFVNGRLAGSSKTIGFIPTNCGQGMEIGFDAGNSAAEIVTAFDGVIDEIKVYRIALTAQDVLREYQRVHNAVGE